MKQIFENEITSKSRGTNIKEILGYKDLIFLFVKRDFVSLYKQTILGPLWVILQPIMTSLIYIVAFYKIANIDTGVPPILFYLIGVTIWTYFSDCVIKTSETFIQNQNIFGKVYFPRLTVPLSIVFTNLIKFLIQFVLFLAVYCFYMPNSTLDLNLLYLLLIPVFIILMIFMGLGLGLIIAGLTTKYRDLRFLIQFGIQLLMFLSPIVYPLKSVPDDFKNIIALNPMTSIIEGFKLGFFGDKFAHFEINHFVYSICISILILIAGLFFFRKVEGNFMDNI